jgi:hypothetical protein
LPKCSELANLRNFVVAIFERAYQEPDLGPKLSAVGQCTTPDSTVVLDTPNEKVYGNGRGLGERKRDSADG